MLKHGQEVWVSLCVTEFLLDEFEHFTSTFRVHMILGNNEQSFRMKVNYATKIYHENNYINDRVIAVIFHKK